MKRLLLSVFILISSAGAFAEASGPQPEHNLRFDSLAERWDEAVPLGNGMVGALIWNEDGVLRFSLDRADLWDNRPVAEYEDPKLNYAWMLGRVNDSDIASIHQQIDRPYDRDPAPTKIPAGRLEFDQSEWGDVNSAELNLSNALCTVKWNSGVRLCSFVHATEPIGWIHITGVESDITPSIIPPPFSEDEELAENVNSLSGHFLSALGYDDPSLSESDNSIVYRQNGWGGLRFSIRVEWSRPAPGEWLGVWTVSSNADPANSDNRSILQAANARGYDADRRSHIEWWDAYWKKSCIDIPDPVIEKQWYADTYKFGSASRRDAPPITLQAIWTADERRVPPWKGDYHHDLNTQLSYWPCYSGNRLDEGLAFLDWLWKIRPANQRWTERFYGHKGLNVPGTTNIIGGPMGGWSQYSFSPTTSAWLAHHFYLHWRYSMDREFLAQRAYPYLRDVAVFLELHSVMKNGVRTLELSSSPEIHDNRLEAWFREITNYDLALIRWLLGATAELADELDNTEDAAHWDQVLDEFPQLALADGNRRLLVSPSEGLQASHRHFSHLMAYHPLGLIDLSHGEDDRQTIEATLDELERLGSDWWVGYSFAWLGNLYARAFDGEKAAAALRDFAECFVSTNTFHLNGDQCNSGKSKFTYRPFTLEGNFAFAAGVQEMLLQSHAGAIRIFPAIPDDWADVSFKNLRGEGAFLVSAIREDGALQSIEIKSLAGQPLTLAMSKEEFAQFELVGISRSNVMFKDGFMHFPTKAGQAYSLKRK